MEKLGFGLSVALIGMLVVFAGLILLIFIIRLVTSVSKSRTAKQAEAPAVPAAAPVSVQAPGVPPEVVAAITAAIAALWQGDTGFVVRHVRRVQNAPAWNRAGREDQIYSRL